MGLFLPLTASAEVTSSISDLRDNFDKVGQAVEEICLCSIMDTLAKNMYPCVVEVLTSEEEKTYMRGQAARVRML